MTSSYRALVVDDEPVAREATVLALQDDGFACEWARDGEEAVAAIARAAFDVVVTDLRMPHRNGHSLAVELLQKVERPVIVVLTGVHEPRLAQDLMRRGVDDFLLKPVDFDLLTHKVKGLIEHRRTRRSGAVVSVDKTPKSTLELIVNCGEPGQIITEQELQKRLSELSHILPISDAALDVVAATSSTRYSVRNVVAILQRDPALVAEVFKHANSAYFSGTGRPPSNLEEAVARLGQRHTCEIAVAANAANWLTFSILPWMSTQRCWRTSLAASACIRLLIPNSGLAETEGLHVGALLHSLGRIVLATLFPKQYLQMVSTCQMDNSCLAAQEEKYFPVDHTAALAQLLENWQLPAGVVEPLRHMSLHYSAVAELEEPLRTKVEVLKLAAAMGRVVGGGWEEWELVEPPPSSLVARWKAQELSAVIKTARAEMNAHCDRENSDQKTTANSVNPPQQFPLKYGNACPDHFDFIAELLSNMGWQLSISPSAGEAIDIMNCVDHSFELAGTRSEMPRLIFAREALPGPEVSARTLLLPTSYSRLRTAVEDLSVSKG